MSQLGAVGINLTVASELWKWWKTPDFMQQGVAPPEGEMPKIKGPFWVVLVFVYSKGAVVRT